MAAGTLIYELPEEKEKVAEIVDSIPSKWCWIDGGLTAPRSLYESGRIAKNTRLFLGRFYSIKPTLIGAHDVPYGEKFMGDKDKTVTPAIRDIVLEGKLVSSVRFDTAGFETHADGITVETVRELAAGFIRLGYKGCIQAYSGYDDNNRCDNPESFSLTHYTTIRSMFDREEPPHVRLDWDPKFCGKRENLEGMISVFSKMGLKELKSCLTI